MEALRTQNAHSDKVSSLFVFVSCDARGSFSYDAAKSDPRASHEITLNEAPGKIRLFTIHFGQNFVDTLKAPAVSIPNPPRRETV